MISPVMVYERIIRDLSGLYERSHNGFCILVLVLRADTVLAAVRRLKDDYGFDQLLEVTADDCPERRPRFEVGYHLYSSRHHKRIRLKMPVPLGETRVPTLTSVHSLAPYLEKEVTTKHGIEFGRPAPEPRMTGRPASLMRARGNGELAM